MYVSVHLFCLSVYLSLIVGQFGESFPFGAGVGDAGGKPVFDDSIFIPISPFTFYGISRTNLFVSHTRPLIIIVNYDLPCAG